MHSICSKNAIARLKVFITYFLFQPRTFSSADMSTGNKTQTVCW